jgi:hypothetical protein
VRSVDRRRGLWERATLVGTLHGRGRCPVRVHLGSGRFAAALAASAKSGRRNYGNKAGANKRAEKWASTGKNRKARAHFIVGDCLHRWRNRESHGLVLARKRKTERIAGPSHRKDKPEEIDFVTRNIFPRPLSSWLVLSLVAATRIACLCGLVLEGCPSDRTVKGDYWVASSYYGGSCKIGKRSRRA